MKKTLFITMFMIVGFMFIPTNFLEAQVISLDWNTFLGVATHEFGYDIAVGSSGNIYIIGESEVSWGSSSEGRVDEGYALVICLNSSGTLIWYRFLGSEGEYSAGWDIEVDSSENIYVTGQSSSTWGAPVNAHSGSTDAFIACLDSSGNLQWNTFLGSADNDSSQGIALDDTGNIYVAGNSNSTWGTPLNAHSGGSDAFVACMDNSGNLLVHTFLGSASNDFVWNLARALNGNIYIVGQCTTTWGSPVNAHSGSYDAFVACLNSTGNLVWNTFLGSSSTDYGWDVALDQTGNIYVSGYSYASWGSPINAYSNDFDAFIVCLASSGNLQWNTFLGSTSTDYGFGITVNESGYLYLTGYSYSSWGSPENPYSGDSDIYVACIDFSGNLKWNTFLGSGYSDYGYGIATDILGNICAVGYGNGTWGSPLNDYADGYDVTVARIMPLPTVDITANGSDGPISISQSETLQIRVSLDTNGSMASADFWLAYKGPSGWVHYNNSTKEWDPGLGVTNQGALMDLNNKKVFQQSGLAPGTYTFYFGVDMLMDGKVTKSSLYKDEVQVTVTQ